MSIEVRHEEGVCVLGVKGPLTSGKSGEGLRWLVRELCEVRPRKILVDLKDTTLMDSIGVGSLVSSYTTVTRKGGQMKLLHLGKRVSRLLSLTRLLTVFEAFEDEGEALRSFGPEDEGS